MFKSLLVASCLVAVAVGQYYVPPTYITPEIAGYVGNNYPVTYNYPNHGNYPVPAPLILGNYGPSVYPAMNYPSATYDPLYAPQPYSANYRVLDASKKASATSVEATKIVPVRPY